MGLIVSVNSITAWELKAVKLPSKYSWEQVTEAA